MNKNYAVPESFIFECRVDTYEQGVINPKSQIRITHMSTGLMAAELEMAAGSRIRRRDALLKQLYDAVKQSGMLSA